jgi:DNA repair exonuclease SbcCD ATPase subunit
VEKNSRGIEMIDLKSLRKKTNPLLADYRHAKRRVSEETEALSSSIKRSENCSQAQVIVCLVAEKVQAQAHTQIASIVTRCLRAVFNDPYEFKIDFERKRGKTEARLTFVKKGYKIDPINGAGGGVVDVASFALQIACILLQRPSRRKVFIADEPFKFVSERKQYRERVRDLIETLAEDLGFQFILVTHDRTLEAGKVIEIV